METALSFLKLKMCGRLMNKHLGCLDKYIARVNMTYMKTERNMPSLLLSRNTSPHPSHTSFLQGTLLRNAKHATQNDSSSQVLSTEGLYPTHSSITSNSLL